MRQESDTLTKLDLLSFSFSRENRIKGKRKKRREKLAKIAPFWDAIKGRTILTFAAAGNKEKRERKKKERKKERKKEKKRKEKKRKEKDREKRQEIRKEKEDREREEDCDWA